MELLFSKECYKIFVIAKTWETIFMRYKNDWEGLKK